MAREAGFMLRAESVKGQSDWWECFDEQIEKLVALARADAIADEREACKKAADDQWVRDPNVSGGDAIRARRNT
jgi:ribosomal protein L17